MVDILIRGWNNLELTEKLILSIRLNTQGIPYQIIYVDNRSDEPPPRRHWQTNVCLPFNHGSVRAINVGLQLALLSPAPYILLLDNDTEIPAGDAEWLGRFVAYFEDETVGAAGATSNYVNGSQYIEFTPDRFTKDFEEGGKQNHKAPQPAPHLVSFAMMLRKSAVEQVGLWDERFEPGMGEDYDYSIRLHDAGWKLVIADSVWIHHKGSQTFGQMGFNELLKEAYWKLYQKWGVERLAKAGIQVQIR